MITDIDRLHKVVSGEDLGRGRGKTFAKCHEVIGHIDLGETRVMVVVSLSKDVDYILPMLDAVSSEAGYELKRLGMMDIAIGESKVRFISSHIRDWGCKLKGVEGALVYMRHDD